MSEATSLLAIAEAWLAQDPDDETRAELAGLVERARVSDDVAVAELHDRFDTRLQFGTAGLRGRIEAGSNRMNRVLVSQAAAGLAAYLLEQAPEGVTPSVVIGYDGRKNSAVFASDTAELMAGAGVRAILLPRLLPTPVLAFAVRFFDASAGVMVTASHNPPADNGYKVYLGGEHHGSQIVSPADAAIAAHIGRIAETALVQDLPRSDGFEIAGEDVVDAYVAETAAVAPAPAGSQLRVVYTAMHGVGWETTRRVFETAGYPAPELVTEQIDPDPTFRTVSFPNPEEPGALDLSFATARAVGADLIIANDPDADRLAIAIPDDAAPSGFRRLTGNEVGLLLGWRAAQAASAALDGDAAPEGTLACSIVSSPALRVVAEAHGLEFRETLTGFKWISRTPGMLFGFEEALGYLVNPGTVRDKDGISAAVAFLGLATASAQAGESVAGLLDQFADTFGSFGSDQISIRYAELSRIGEVMSGLRALPPTELAGARVTRIDDLADGFEALPPSDVLRVWLDDGTRVMIRPSGTEPKLKVYVDVQSADGDAAERAATVTARLAALRTDLTALVS
ncbi:phospho-sugar mutase [Plantibacter sp. VKM Ac-2885]|uniref:phospho-sugar mutase n=1 Tax=Plantibacter TaxID=190323 RepID=UPI0010C216D8|nr:phospho-sugar mutase [Plantibacter flavus]MBD8516538.1 phospho-sugar mutase [Plantibacter sp. CFBP 8804]MBF4514341.1 phospho-sugar mutase [Plantibacter sp. VKM Ac-2885]TKJ96562.1 phosphomannomutase [Plantibacter flavus]